NLFSARPSHFFQVGESCARPLRRAGRRNISSCSVRAPPFFRDACFSRPTTEAFGGDLLESRLSLDLEPLTGFARRLTARAPPRLLPSLPPGAGRARGGLRGGDSVFLDDSLGVGRLVLEHPGARRGGFRGERAPAQSFSIFDHFSA